MYLAQKKHALPAGAAGLLVLLVGLALSLNSGCEIDSADASLTITPSAAVVGHVGHSVTLTADGGYRYEWSLGNSQWGTLNTYRGREVVYTSRYQPTDLPVVQTIKVTSYFSDNDSSNTGGSTNNPTTGTVHYAEAYITHLVVSTN